MCRSFTLIASMALALLTGCLDSDDTSSVDGGFSGKARACSDLLMVRADAAGYRVLQVSVPGRIHFRDTVYETSIGPGGGSEVVIERFNRKGMVTELFCNDVMPHPEPVRRDSIGAVSGTLSLVIYDMDVDTINVIGIPFYEKYFRVDAELRDVHFNYGTHIETLRLDSLRAGWLPG